MTKNASPVLTRAVEVIQCCFANPWHSPWRDLFLCLAGEQCCSVLSPPGHESVQAASKVEDEWERFFSFLLWMQAQLCCCCLVVCVCGITIFQIDYQTRNNWSANWLIPCFVAVDCFMQLCVVEDGKPSLAKSELLSRRLLSYKLTTAFASWSTASTEPAIALNVYHQSWSKLKVRRIIALLALP